MSEHDRTQPEVQLITERQYRHGHVLKASDFFCVGALHAHKATRLIVVDGEWHGGATCDHPSCEAEAIRTAIKAHEEVSDQT